MGIFRRRDKSNTVPEVSGDQDAVTPEGPEVPDPLEGLEGLEGAEGLDGVAGLEERDEQPLNRARGPFDVTELAAEGDEVVPRLDLGALRLVPVEGMQLRLEIDEAQQTVLSVHAILGESGVQLQAFAAPRTLPVWPEIRDEIATNVTAGGGTADVVRGELGRELLCRMPQQGADGRTVFAQVRFAGIDGPRWFLRAVFSGPAAIDETAAAPLVALVRGAVVVRGDDAMPPREVLPLTLPQDAQDAQDAQETADEGVGEAAPADEVEPESTHLDDLKPFERGPEITEVR